MLEQMVQVFQIFLRSLLPDVFIIDSPPIGTFLKWKYTEQLTTIFFLEEFTMFKHSLNMQLSNYSIFFMPEKINKQYMLFFPL